jgi:hypothetical protein
LGNQDILQESIVQFVEIYPEVVVQDVEKGFVNLSVLKFIEISNVPTLKFIID